MSTSAKPVLEIDLLGPDGNVFVVLARVSELLEATHGAKEGKAKFKEITQWMDEGNGDGEYEQLLQHIHDNYVEIEDESGEYDFY